MIKLISTLGALSVLASPTFAATVTYSGATHCAVDAILQATAVENLIESEGTLDALQTIATEHVGSVDKGYFYFNPLFERTTRYFNCSIPLTAEMDTIALSVYGIVENLNNSLGGCSISRMVKVSDGGIDKWFEYETGKGFDWISLDNADLEGEQFVNYKTEINNYYEPESTLALHCRTTWSTGSVALGQISLSY